MFSELSDQARVWIYGFRDELDEHDSAIVHEYFKQFVNGWHSHKKDVRGTYNLLYNRFVVLVAENEVSGCSIDSSVHVLKKLKSVHGLDALDQSLVFYIDNDKIKSANRLRFRSLYDEGIISADTMMFDQTVSTLGEFRSGWIKRFAESWHNRAFRKSA